MEQACWLDTVPRDIKIKIVSLMDIDTRIKTRMIFKLRIPQALHNKLNNMFDSLIINKSLSCIKLGPYRPLFNSNLIDDIETMYTLTRYFNTTSTNSQSIRSVNYTVCHVSRFDAHDNIIKMKIHYVPSFDKC
jgi:hypothetical protein